MIEINGIRIEKYKNDIIDNIVSYWLIIQSHHAAVQLQDSCVPVQSSPWQGMGTCFWSWGGWAETHRFTPIILKWIQIR